MPRVVHTSSVAAIGVRHGGVADETYQSPYAKLVGVYKKSKFLGERVAREAAAAGQDVVIVNPSTPIGPWDVKPTPTGEIVLRFARGAMPAYVDTGLNLIDVRDCAAGHRLAYERGVAGERYILGNLNLALREIFVRLAKITQRSVPRFRVPQAVPLAYAAVGEYMLGAAWASRPTSLWRASGWQRGRCTMTREKRYVTARLAAERCNRRAGRCGPMVFGPRLSRLAPKGPPVNLAWPSPSSKHSASDRT